MMRLWPQPGAGERDKLQMQSACSDSLGAQLEFIPAGTSLQPLLEEGDLLTQGVDSVQLLEGVGQSADGVCADVLWCRWHEVVEGSQHQLEFLLQCFHSVLQVFHFFLHFTGGICLAEGSWLGAWHHGLACLVISSEAKAIPAGTVEAPSCIDAELTAPVAPACTLICI